MTQLVLLAEEDLVMQEQLARTLRDHGYQVIAVRDGLGLCDYLELARFSNPTGLLSQGENIYTETPASGQAVTGFPNDEGMGQLVQGSLEGSNVEVVQEMVDMISAQRAYELNSKAVKATDEMSEIATQIVR